MFADLVPTPAAGRMIAVSLVVLSWVPRAEAGDPTTSDRVRQAIAYLDARQDEWSRFATAQRGEGADRTACVSCHTGLSYALARPTLRPLALQPGPAAPEQRLLGTVHLRAEHSDALDTDRFELMYDFNDRKKVESRGTEAVLNALILARDDAQQRLTTPSTATLAALKDLWAAQATVGKYAGSWDWLDFGLQPWEGTGSRAFGAALATIAIGSAPGYLDQPLDERATSGVRALRDYLRGRSPEESLYNRLWILEASSAVPDLLTSDQQREVIDQLLAARRDDGGWSLASLGSYKRVDGTTQPQDSDGYATGLALHTLLGAGRPKASPEVARGLDWLRAHQRSDGSWLGRSLNKERDPATFIGRLMADAATAMAATALVEAESH